MRRRLTTILAIAAALALIAVPATAQDAADTDGPDGHEFAGTAEATSFELSIAGQGLVAGQTTAGVQSSADRAGALCEQSIVACATGAGEAAFGGTAQASVEDDAGTEQNSVSAFSSDELPSQFQQAPLTVTGQFGAASAEAISAEKDGTDTDASSAHGHANAVTLSVVSQGSEQFGGLADQLQGLLGQGGDSGDEGGDSGENDGGALPETGTPLDQILEMLPSPGGESNPLSGALAPLTEGLQGLAEQIQAGTAILSVELGTSNARADHGADGDTFLETADAETRTQAVAEGGTVTVLGGLATIEVGDSTASTGVGPGEGDATASASSVPLTVSLASGPELPDALAPLQDALQQLPQLGTGEGLSFEVPQGQAVCLADEIEAQAGTQLPDQAAPLLALLDVYISAGGSSTDVEGRSAGARADALALELFNDNCGPSADSDPLGAVPAIVLNTATAQATVGAPVPNPATTDDVSQDTEVAQESESLPRTGGGSALAALALLGGGAMLLRRRS